METGKHNAMTTDALVVRELSGADFGDARLSARLLKVAEACAAAPERSLPKAMQSKQDLEAAYRLFANDAVGLKAILQPHQQQTVERIAAERVALALWDTTQFEFNGAREGLGRLNGTSAQGFLLHAGLAVSAEGNRRPLGVLDAHTWVRTGEPHSKTASGQNRSGADYAHENDKESARWADRMIEAEKLVGQRASLVHVADREADADGLLHTLITRGSRFVIRVHYDRTTLGEDERRETLSTACERAPLIVSRRVPLTRRVAKSAPRISKSLAAREARDAKISIRAMRVTICRPRYADGKTLELNLVHVREIDPPPGVEPVEWRLYTTEPIDTAEHVLDVVDYYRARWVIEEFFKALKTGCQFEKLQLESYGSLTNALGVYLPIAWSILLLRSLARTQPDAPATVALSSTEIAVLHALGKLTIPCPTVAEALLAVAMLGGYIKHKIGPGWLVLARGMQDLQMLERGWAARKALEDVRDR